jgi:hypothetical protein
MVPGSGPDRRGHHGKPGPGDHEPDQPGARRRARLDHEIHCLTCYLFRRRITRAISHSARRSQRLRANRVTIPAGDLALRPRVRSVGSMGRSLGRSASGVAARGGRSEKLRRVRASFVLRRTRFAPLLPASLLLAVLTSVIVTTALASFGARGSPRPCIGGWRPRREPRSRSVGRLVPPRPARHARHPLRDAVGPG